MCWNISKRGSQFWINQRVTWKPTEDRWRVVNIASYCREDPSQPAELARIAHMYYNISNRRKDQTSINKKQMNFTEFVNPGDSQGPATVPLDWAWAVVTKVKDSGQSTAVRSFYH